VDAGAGTVRALRGRVRKQLGKLFPFFPENLLVMASPFDGLPPEIPGTQKPPAAIPPIPMPRVYSAAEGPRAFDLLGLPHTTGIKNLYVAGRENLPGAGVEGEMVSAWGVARLVAGTSPKRDTGRREVLLNEG